MIESKFDILMRCYGGGGGGGAYRPPKPPSPTLAAENVAKRQIMDRQRQARGYGSTRSALLSQPQTQAVKTLLGQ